MLDPQQDRPPEREIRLADLDAGNVTGIVGEFNGWLAELLQRKGSDLHVKVGAPPKFREAGALVPLDRTPLTHFETEAIGNAIVPSDRMETAADHRRGGFRVLPRRRGAVPRQRLPSAGVDLRGPAQAPVRRARRSRTWGSRT